MTVRKSYAGLATMLVIELALAALVDQNGLSRLPNPGHRNAQQLFVERIALDAGLVGGAREDTRILDVRHDQLLVTCSAARQNLVIILHVHERAEGDLLDIRETRDP